MFTHVTIQVWSTLQRIQWMTRRTDNKSQWDFSYRKITYTSYSPQFKFMSHVHSHLLHISHELLFGSLWMTCSSLAKALLNHQVISSHRAPMIHIILDRHWLLKDPWHLQISMDNCWWLSKWRHYSLRTASVESVPERCLQLLQQGKQASHNPNVHWHTRPMAASFARFEYKGCCRSTSCMTWKIKGMFNLRNKKISYKTLKWQ